MAPKRISSSSLVASVQIITGARATLLGPAKAGLSLPSPGTQNSNMQGSSAVRLPSPRYHISNSRSFTAFTAKHDPGAMTQLSVLFCLSNSVQDKVLPILVESRWHGPNRSENLCASATPVTHKKQQILHVHQTTRRSCMDMSTDARTGDVLEKSMQKGQQQVQARLPVSARILTETHQPPHGLATVRYRQIRIQRPAKHVTVHRRPAAAVGTFAVARARLSQPC